MPGPDIPPDAGVAEKEGRAVYISQGRESDLRLPGSDGAPR